MRRGMGWVIAHKVYHKCIQRIRPLSWREVRLKLHPNSRTESFEIFPSNGLHAESDVADVICKDRALEVGFGSSVGEGVCTQDSGRVPMEVDPSAIDFEAHWQSKRASERRGEKSDLGFGTLRMGSVGHAFLGDRSAVVT